MTILLDIFALAAIPFGALVDVVAIAWRRLRWLALLSLLLKAGILRLQWVLSYIEWGTKSSLYDRLSVLQAAAFFVSFALDAAIVFGALRSGRKGRVTATAVFLVLFVAAEVFVTFVVLKGLANK